MTKPYLIQAWCLRPFISYLDIARTQSKQLLDNAEECNGEYLWDRFAAHGERGNELLHILDPGARLREAAPAMRDMLAHVVPVLVYVTQVLADAKPDSLPPGMDAALEHIEKILVLTNNATTSPTSATAATDQD